jgi:hypothetical protein
MIRRSAIGETPMRYCGREFTTDQLQQIRQIIAQSPSCRRAALSRLVCEHLDWRKPDGGLKEMSCRVAMLRMQDDGLLTLPAPRNGNANGRPRVRLTSGTDPGQPITAPVHQLGEIRLQMVCDRTVSRLWNEYIQRYHYLGYQPLPGAQLRYLAQAAGQTVALLGFAAAAWKTAPRDRWIGWNDGERQTRLHLIANNARFLILPWVECQNLASKLLAMAARCLPGDWQQRYGYHPVLLETFVDTERFTGHCYRSANWIRVGQTQGRGKLDQTHRPKLPIKDVWIYPLRKNSRSTLCT